jgi:hypothetical protein
MNTGKTVDTLGLYSTECCNVELIFDIGDTFVRCPRCSRLSEWELQDEIVNLQDEDGNSELAA